MIVNVNRFIEKYSSAVHEGHAALFAGAGLSMPSGFVDWKELLRPFAEEIRLSIDREHDYPAIAQYYCNEKGGRRVTISNEIMNRFSEGHEKNAAIEIVTRLPIHSYWTTNFDALIEQGLERNNRRPDVKRRVEDLTLNKTDSDAIVYKMHGDITEPAKIVLLKDDYETYEKDRGLFATVLSGALVSNTFLFIGFSFEDPNLWAIMSRIKTILGNQTREHYCLFEKARKQDDESDDDFKYRELKQNLLINDLQRYGIATVLLESYSDMPSILTSVENRVRKSNVFISGSIAKGDDKWTLEEAENFAMQIADGLVKADFRITSGYGERIGSAVITGALASMNKKSYAHMDEYLQLYPFPQSEIGDDDSKELWADYRERMLSDCGVAVFVFGNKEDSSGSVVTADGMLEEFEIAKRNGARLIPLASTGYTSEKLCSAMEIDKESYPYLDKFWDILKNERKIDTIVKMIQAISKEE